MLGAWDLAVFAALIVLAGFVESAEFVGFVVFVEVDSFDSFDSIGAYVAFAAPAEMKMG